MRAHKPPICGRSYSHRRLSSSLPCWPLLSSLETNGRRSGPLFGSAAPIMDLIGGLCRRCVRPITNTSSRIRRSSARARANRCAGEIQFGQTVASGLQCPMTGRRRTHAHTVAHSGARKPLVWALERLKMSGNGGRCVCVRFAQASKAAASERALARIVGSLGKPTMVRTLPVARAPLLETFKTTERKRLDADYAPKKQCIDERRVRKWSSVGERAARRHDLIQSLCLLINS